MINRATREKALDIIINKETKLDLIKKSRADKLLKRYGKKMIKGHNNGDIGGTYSYFLDFDFQHMQSQLLEIYGGAVVLDCIYTGTEFKVTFKPTLEYRESEINV